MNRQVAVQNFHNSFCALGRRSYIKRQKETLPPPTVPTPLPPSPPTIIPDVFLHPFKGSRLNITALSKSDVTITQALSEACATCTVGPDTAPAYEGFTHGLGRCLQYRPKW
jgi:hypothetical protein